LNTQWGWFVEGDIDIHIQFIGICILTHHLSRDLTMGTPSAVESAPHPEIRGLEITEGYLYAAT
jgi:hypothetical protein